VEAENLVSVETAIAPALAADILEQVAALVELGTAMLAVAVLVDIVEQAVAVLLQDQAGVALADMPGQAAAVLAYTDKDLAELSVVLQLAVMPAADQAELRDAALPAANTVVAVAVWAQAVTGVPAVVAAG
jgi:hypothetical protein